MILHKCWEKYEQLNNFWKTIITLILGPICALLILIPIGNDLANEVRIKVAFGMIWLAIFFSRIDYVHKNYV